MIETILHTVLSTGVLFLSAFSAPTLAPHYTFTQVLPQENYVTHTVYKGQTLKSIAKDYYKNQAQWTTILNDNTAIAGQSALPEGYLLKIRVKVNDEPEKLIAQGETVKPTAIPSKPIEASPAPVKVYAAPSSYDDVYKQAGAKYGVPWQVLYGLHMTESGGRNGPIASGRGPQGPMQFMPGTWRAYAVDGDGDGVTDINNATDAIHGAANYLAKHGSLDTGLRAYGGNTPKTLALARERGFVN